MTNPVKAKLAAGEVSIGTWVYIGHPDVAEMLAGAGFDWLLFDLEHGPCSIETLQVLLQASAAGTAVPLVRVPPDDPALVGRVLDAGARGVVFPMVETPDAAERAVRACKYPPQGARGLGPRRCAAYGRAFQDYVATANDDTLVAIQIESPDGVRNVDEILSVPGIDAILLGLGDLSLQMGHLADRDHPDLQRAVRRVLEACRRRGVAPGLAYAGTPAIANHYREMGFRMLGLGTDDDFLLAGAQRILAGVAELATVPKDTPGGSRPAQRTT